MSVDSPFAANDCKEITSVVELIYAAVESPSLWSQVLDELADLVHGDIIVMFANYANSIASDIHTLGSDGADILKSYLHYAPVNVWTEKCDLLFPRGAIRYSHLAVPDSTLKKTEFYSDWLKPNGIGYGFGVEISLPEQSTALLSAVRDPQKGPFREEQEGRILQAVLPHLQRALRLHVKFTNLHSANQSLEVALDAFGHAVFGLDDQGKVLFCNSTARRLVSQQNGLHVKHGVLVADSPAQNRELQFHLRQASISGTRITNSGAILISRNSGLPALRMTIMPFASNLLGHIPKLSLLAFIDDPARRPHSRAEVLRKLFQLSPTEARLVDLLASGLDLRNAAEQLQMTIATARFHLKSVFKKTDVNRQADLARLVTSLPGCPEP